MDDFSFTTGSSPLPDIGVLSYNGCVFSPLFLTSVSGVVVKDDARRTTKCMQYTLEVDGYVTSGADANLLGIGIAPTMKTLRELLTAQGGALVYRGRGFDLVVNAAGTLLFTGAARDVVWGPAPELLEFQPLGAGMSAKVKWRVTVTVTEEPKSLLDILQFNYETTVAYNEDGFSTLSMRGTMEVPQTRNNQKDRKSTSTVDDLRGELDDRIFVGIDLSRFRVTHREYNISRDKRTMDFSITVEEKPYMDLPPDAMVAHGNYSVKQATSGMGCINWLCTLSANYTIAPQRPRRVAYFAFLALLRERMRYSVIGFDPTIDPVVNIPSWNVPSYTDSISFWNRVLLHQDAVLPPREEMSAWIIDFSFEEGLYLDSKTIAFSATWRLVIKSFEDILNASGLWKKVGERDVHGNNVWAIAMSNVSGSQSWLANKLDAALDVIVDFGGG